MKHEIERLDRKPWGAGGNPQKSKGINVTNLQGKVTWIIDKGKNDTRFLLECTTTFYEYNLGKIRTTVPVVAWHPLGDTIKQKLYNNKAIIQVHGHVLNYKNTLYVYATEIFSQAEYNHDNYAHGMNFVMANGKIIKEKNNTEITIRSRYKPCGWAKRKTTILNAYTQKVITKKTKDIPRPGNKISIVGCLSGAQDGVHIVATRADALKELQAKIIPPDPETLLNELITSANVKNPPWTKTAPGGGMIRYE